MTPRLLPLLESPDRSRLFWIFQIGGWALFGAGMFAAGVSQWPVAYAAVVKSSLTLFGLLATLLLRWIYRGVGRRGLPIPGVVVAAIPLSYAAAGLWMAAHNFAVAFYNGRRAASASASAAALAAFPDFNNTIYYFFLLLAWSILYFGIQAYLDLLAHRERLLRAEALAHQARLRALRLQLNPHFLFNSLNAISTLIREGSKDEANRMLTRLADFLRATLDRTETDEVPLSEEIDFACRYLDLEETRFGERLRVDISVAEGTEGALVPPLILQPLVENAVRYAILPREGGGAIAITAARSDGWLTLGVDDDGPGMEGAPAAPPGVGHTNIRQRLAELYGPGAELRLSRSRSGGLAASIRLPFRVAPGGA